MNAIIDFSFLFLNVRQESRPCIDHCFELTEEGTEKCYSVHSKSEGKFAGIIPVND